jgi:phenylacetate-CoA ligase
VLISPQEALAWIKAVWERARVQRLSRLQLEAEQAEKFRALVRLVYERSPFYRAIIRERSLDVDRCRPSDFPVLTKQTVADNFDQMLTDSRLSRSRIEQFLTQSRDPSELLDGRYHVLHSSGTSGTVGYMVYSHDEWIKGATQMLRVFPLRLRTRVAFVGATRGHFAGASLVLSGNHKTNRLFYDVQTFDVSRPMDQMIAALNRFQPHVLTGYAGLLERMAEAQEEGAFSIKPRVVVCGAEPMRPRSRPLLQKAFGVPIVNSYASSEHLFMAFTLPGSDGMHLLEDDLIFELQEDCTYVTNLFNHTLPLIRYRMNDVLIQENDSSGRYPFTKIRDLVGRFEDAAVFVNREGREDSIHPSLIAELVVPGLKSWQIQLIDDASFVFNARFEAGRGREEKQAVRRQIREQLREILAEKRMENVDFQIEEVDRLEIDPASGKTRMILKPKRQERAVTPSQPRTAFAGSASG